MNERKAGIFISYINILFHTLIVFFICATAVVLYRKRRIRIVSVDRFVYCLFQYYGLWTDDGDCPVLCKV